MAKAGSDVAAGLYNDHDHDYGTTRNRHNNHSEEYLPASHLEKSQYAWTGTLAEG